MTKQEIQALIDQKIAGQGTMVDVGGALPKILTEILNAAFAGANVQSDWEQDDNTKADYIKNKPTIPSGGGGGTVVKLTAPFNNQTNYTKAQMAALIGVSEADLDVILEGAADTILEVTEEMESEGVAFTHKSFIRPVNTNDVPSVGVKNVRYACWDENNDYNTLTLIKEGDSYTISSTYAPSM